MKEYLFQSSILAAILVSLVYSASVTGGNECSSCPDHRYVHHYLARGCSPVPKPGCQDCVERYDCPLVQKASNKCYYGGEAYDVGQDIRVPNPCSKCRCSGRSDSDKTEINCAFVECPEIFSPPDHEILNASCYFSYKPGRCCGEKRCARAELEQPPPATCNHQGKVYREGEQIHLDNCYTCACTEGFDPARAKENPACHQNTCYFNTKLLNDGCIPVYLPSGCCYSQFHCPSPSLEQRQQHCQQGHYYGYCDKNETWYYFDGETNACKPFTYSGCGKSINTFETEQECMKYCTGPDPERPAPQPGKCYFDGKNYDIGSVLSPEPSFNCTCSIPPDFTCLLTINN